MKIAFKRDKKKVVSKICNCQCVNTYATARGLRIIHH